MADSAVVDTQTEPDSEAEGSSETEVVARDTSLNIHQRIHAVMVDVAYVSKESVHEIKKDGKKVGEFNYTSHDTATAAVRQAIVHHGILIVPTMTGHKDNGNRVEMDIRVDFINVDTPSDVFSVDMLGYGVDKFDKGPGKAVSYATKMVVLKTFQLIGGNEPEDDNTEHEPEKPTANQQIAAEHQDVQKQKEWAETYKAAVLGAKTPQEIDRLRKENKTMFKSLPPVSRDYFVDLMERRKDEFEDAKE